VLAGPGTITTIAGLTFAISDELGDVGPGAFGLIAGDTRHLSRLQVAVDGEPLMRLGAGLMAADAARFRAYAVVPGHGPDPPLEVERVRRVRPAGLDEEVIVTCWGSEPVEFELSVAIDCDFADIFEVRSLGGGSASADRTQTSRSARTITFASRDGSRGTTVGLSPAADRYEGDASHWRLRLGRGERWRLRIKVRADGVEPPEGLPAIPPPRRTAEVASRPTDLARACRRSLADLQALTLPDGLAPGRRLLAAGIPWFVALFGRDSIIASHQARLFEPARMLDALQALAARQGRVNDPGNEEQPGKILHEVRLTERAWLGSGTTGGARPYYGSADATPLFVILYGAAWRWGASREALLELLPAVRAAMGWIRGDADPDDDGLIEYRPTSPRSLINQGWKDSANSVQFADGRLAEPPIAIVEVQGYAYRARRELAAVLAWLGEEREAEELTAEADAQRVLVRERFWCDGGEGPGFFALALDGGKARVDSVASNMAHLLWCGVPSNEEAEQVASHLTGEAMASGWGLRTLSRTMAGFNPISYHVGSVWPHDTGIACEGLRRYGLDREALALAGALIDALALFDDRLPELFGGHSRAESRFPVPYPTACRPQAWAAGVPLDFAALFLGVEPFIPGNTISLSPILPPGLESLEVRGIPFPSGHLSVAIDRDGARVIEAPSGVEIALRAVRAGVAHG
jgi:glycogen debranching enzyme